MNKIKNNNQKDENIILMNDNIQLNNNNKIQGKKAQNTQNIYKNPLIITIKKYIKNNFWIYSLLRSFSFIFNKIFLISSIFFCSFSSFWKLYLSLSLLYSFVLKTKL